MKKLLVFASITAVVFFAAVLPVRAMVPYMLFQAGAGVPNADDMEDANVGFAGNITFGAKFLPYLAGQVETGYTYNTGDHGLKFSSIPLVAAVRLMIPVGGVEPYFIAGGGAYFVNAKNETDGGSTIYDQSSTEYGLFGGGGVNFNINKFIVGFEFRYLALDTDKVDASTYQSFVNFGFSF